MIPVKIMRQLLFTTVALALAATTAALFMTRAGEPEHKTEATKNEARPGTAQVKNIGVQEFEKLRTDKKNVVLDVRTSTEYAAGHMPGAINIDVNGSEFEKKVKALDPSKTYLVHCAAGVRSARACGKLSKLNFGHLYNLEGGFRAWEKAGNKAEK
jgi:phage shock protein E